MFTVLSLGQVTKVFGLLYLVMVTGLQRNGMAAIPKITEKPEEH